MHILLTRPLEDCSEMIIKFQSLGHRVSHLPLLIVEKINYEILNEKPTSYLAGKYMGDLMEAEQKATINTFIKKKFYLRTIQFALGPHLSFLILEIGIQLIL